MERLKGEGVHDWLSQHLTTSWHGHQTVASELGNDIIANIKERWSQLESSVRLGVLFSLISLKKAQQLQLKDKCQELIDHACSDPDDWVRLVSQMLKEFPKDATLRFNVEQFADQAQLGSLLDELTSHISRDGIKFHPKEFAYLSESVCRSGQGKDSATKTYPPLTGPSLQRHFNLKDSHVDIHTERAERLKKMAAQASPIVASGSFPSVGAGALGATTGNIQLSNASASSTSVGGGGSTATLSTAPLASGSSAPSSGPLGPPGQPPRPPTKSSSTGLFVRKPAGSFLRNNAPRPMALARNPSAGQLPLRSPRLDSPTTPRLNQKSSRIQILDIQQGNEIMQNMNDEKRRKEQAEQREKELKKEQRQHELELKRQQDAEKKAQLQKEKEEKKREREEARKNKERQKQDKDRQKQEKDHEQDHDSPQTGETRRQPDDDDDVDGDEGSLSSLPAKKKSRPNKSSSRRGSRDDDEDNDYDNDRPDRSEPISPVTPSNNYAYSNQEGGQPTPAITHSEGNGLSDSYFPSHQQQHQQHQQQQQPQPQPQPQPTSSVISDYPTIFQDTNMLTQEDRAYIEAFLEGHPIMNQNQVQDAAGRVMYETILIEMNFDTGEWKKIKRRRAKPHVPASAAQ
ncbi:hypothetical protein BGZ76_008728 [Entomortierella beljakovae]|nr:hypothetical protein BGZ76_008728 [Entomortierella beljakovae]